MPLPVMNQNEPNLHTVTIAAAGSLSGAVSLPPGHYLAAIIMPAAWTTADLTFQGSVDGTVYNNLYSASGSELTASAGAAQMIVLPPTDWCAVPFLKVRSGTAALAVAQDAARALTLISRPS
jgi:hypothetical protein